MVLVDVATNRLNRPIIARTFHRLAHWISQVRTERQKRTALRSLLFAPEHRLRDLGITREELLQAIARRR